MWYRYHRPRRWRGGFFFPFPFIFFFLFMGWGHGEFGLLTWVLPIIILLAFGAIIRNRVAGSYQQPYQNNQLYGNQGSYSDPNYYYQRPYTPYQQGYQAEQARETPQESGNSASYPQQEQYQEYEQPQAQYPEQMPPMQ
jgi:hypothetical protein